MINCVPWARVSARTRARKPAVGNTMPQLVSAGSQSTAATSPGANAAASARSSLNSTTRVVWVTSLVAPKSPGASCVRPFTRITWVSSSAPWQASNTTRVLRPVAARTQRSKKRLASEAVVAICHCGSPNLATSNSPTSALAAAGNVADNPSAICALKASTKAGGLWPNIAAVSPKLHTDGHRHPSRVRPARAPRTAGTAMANRASNAEACRQTSACCARPAARSVDAAHGTAPPHAHKAR